jgi:hypothetical protein
VLTTLDKLLFVLFVLFTLACGAVVSMLAFVYADPFFSTDIDRLGIKQNVSLPGCLSVIVGLFLGYAVAVCVCGLLSRRFAPASVHQRWAEALDPDNQVTQRGQGMLALMRTVLIPREYRPPSNGS